MSKIEYKKIKEQIVEAQATFLNSIPWNAYRFFVGKFEDVHMYDTSISFNEADSFEVNDPAFRECLEFWVKHAGGKIKWSKE